MNLYWIQEDQKSTCLSPKSKEDSTWASNNYC